MDNPPGDNFKGLDEIINRIIEQSRKQGNDKPIMIGIKVMIVGQPPCGMPDIPAMERSPDVEVHRVDGEVKLITELPGMSAENVHVFFRGDTVHIRACDGDRSIRTSAEVPPADRDSVAFSFRHGVLEITYRERQEAAREESSGAPDPGGYA
jgi:HSP20 family molecular chaperone IbpA